MFLMVASQKTNAINSLRDGPGSIEARGDLGYHDSKDFQR